MARKPKLPDKKTLESILTYIRAGSFPHIAAQAHGIAPSTFFRWMQQGKQGLELYAEFWEKVMRAHSQKRASAEIEVAKESPLAWLRYGPGRSRPGEPGWTDEPPPLPGENGEEAEPDELTDAERAATIASILDRARARAARPAVDAGAADGDVGT